MITVTGADFIQAIEAPDHLGSDVTPDMVRQWKRRRLVTGYPVGRATYYRLTELVEVEFVTRSSGRGRARQHRGAPMFNLFDSLRTQLLEADERRLQSAALAALGVHQPIQANDRRWYCEGCSHFDRSPTSPTLWVDCRTVRAVGRVLTDS